MKQFEFEFENAKNGKWSYHIYYGLDIVGSVYGNEKDTNIIIHNELNEGEISVLKELVAKDLDITLEGINFIQ